MELSDILPFAIPGILIQLSVQVYYIRHCWLNPELSQQRKAAFIATIALFNIAGAVVYLFLTRKRDATPLEQYEEGGVDTRIRETVFLLLLIAFEVFSVRTIMENLGNPMNPLITGLLAACFLILVGDALFVSRKKVLSIVFPVLQLASVLVVAYLDQTEGMPFFVLAVVASVINGHPLRKARLYALSTLVLSLGVLVARTIRQTESIQSDALITTVYVSLIVYLLVYLAFYSLKKQLLANERLQQAVHMLRDQTRQIEEMTALAERSRIAGEIHDTVGHTLTTAVLSVEAGRQLMVCDPEAARGKLDLAEEQIRRGLADIRGSVRMIRNGQEQTFEPALRQLLQDIHTRTGLKVHAEVDAKSVLLPIQQRVLLRAVTECATNSLKHGRSTEADVLIQEHHDAILFTFSDNGQGIDTIQPGFGLDTMRARVESLGGRFDARSARGEGFTVMVSLPIVTDSGGAI